MDSDSFKRGRKHRHSREPRASPLLSESGNANVEAAIIDWADNVLNDLEVDWGRRKKHVRQQGRRTRGRIHSKEIIEDHDSAPPAAAPSAGHSHSMKARPPSAMSTGSVAVAKRADSVHANSGALPSYNGYPVLTPVAPRDDATASDGHAAHSKPRSPDSFMSKLRYVEQLPARPPPATLVIQNPPERLLP